MTFRLSALFLALLAAGCASAPPQPPDSLSAQFASAKAAVTTSNIVTEQAPVEVLPSPAATAPADAAPKAPAKPESASRVFPGNDQLFKRDIGPQVDPVLARGEKVSLNFENATVGNLATALLGDLLKLNYTVDAGAETVVSLRTSQPLPRSQVLDVLDAVLLPHDLAIVRDPDPTEVTAAAVLAAAVLAVVAAALSLRTTGRVL